MTAFPLVIDRPTISEMEFLADKKIKNKNNSVHPVAKVMWGRKTIDQITSKKNPIHCLCCTPNYVLSRIENGPDKMKFNGPERHNSWQWMKHAKLFSDLLQATPKQNRWQLCILCGGGGGLGAMSSSVVAHRWL